MFIRLCKKYFYIHRIFRVNINTHLGKIFTLLNAKQAIGLFNRVKRDAIQLVRSIYRANKAKDKLVYLETFLDDFELLKFEIRLCVDMKILAIKKQAELSGLMDSIGKQITGWRNANR